MSTSPSVHLADPENRDILIRLNIAKSCWRRAKSPACVCQLDLAPFDALIWPHLGLVPPARADASSWSFYYLL